MCDHARIPSCGRRLCQFAFCFIFAVCASAESVEAQLFVTPLGGAPYEDWTIVNYVDLDTSSGTEDWRGGPYTYDGHGAIDFTLPNFAAMDEGVPVFAAADGVVTQIQDGFFDRSTGENPAPGNEVNLVRIDHGNGIETRYLHLRKYSLEVAVGDSVVQGQQIAMVGSSGSSTDAHLHFDVYKNGSRIESYLDPETYWIDPLPYAGDVSGILDFGVTDHNPDIPEHRERAEEVAYYFLGEGASPTAWVNLHSLPGDWLHFKWYRPDGSLCDSNVSLVNRIRYGWREDQVSLPENIDSENVGEWRIAAFLGDSISNSPEVGRISFYALVEGDVNMDAVVDEDDVAAFVQGWDHKQSEGDINSWQLGDMNLDGETSILDAVILNRALIQNGQSGFDFSLLNGAIAPEPRTLVLFMIALGILLQLPSRTKLR